MGTAVTTIRPMTEDDLDVVVELEAAQQPAPWTRQMFTDELTREDRVYLVAEEPGAIVAFAGVMIIGDESHVTNLLVDETRRRRGIGRLLMRDLVEASVAAGARHLTLEVRKENEEARAFYSGLGLAPVGVRPRYYGDDDALILWAHDIDRPDFLESSWSR